MTAITKEQIRKIHTIKSALLKAAYKSKPDDETLDECKERMEEQYRLMVIEVHGFSGTSKDLTEAEAATLIRRLEEKAMAAGVWKKYNASPTTRVKYEELGHRKGYATPPQLRMIEAMWKEVSYHQDEESREHALRWFLLRLVKVQKLEWLKIKDVSTVVEALQAMQTRPSVGCSNRI